MYGYYSPFRSLVSPQLLRAGEDIFVSSHPVFHLVAVLQTPFNSFLLRLPRYQGASIQIAGKSFEHLSWAIIGRLPSLFVTQFSSALWSIPFVERLSLPQSPVIAPTIDYCELAVY